MIKPDNTAEARALDAVRHRFLTHIARHGPVPVARLPVRWPLTRYHARLVVRDLSRDGLVCFARTVDERATVLALTDAGRRVVEERSP